jgi:hypothetical protein
VKPKPEPRRHTETDTVYVPRSWWDHLKHDVSDWFGENVDIARPFDWWLDRHPVRYRRVWLVVTWYEDRTEKELRWEE